MSSSNLVRIGYKKESVLGVTPAAVAATGVLDMTADVTLTSVEKGAKRNTKTFTVNVGAAGSNPGATILASFTGTKDAVVCNITPNNGANNTGTPVNMTTAQLAELINTGAVVGKTVTVTDTQGLRALQTASGGNGTNLANGGEGDGEVATFSGGSGDFQTARFVSEQYSGTPETTESAQIRTDRQSSGQVVTGLTVEGGHTFELAKEKAIEDFMESAMSNSWVTTPEVLVSLEINATTRKVIRSSGSFVDEGVKVGQFLQLDGFPSAVNNTVVMVMVVTALEITFAGPEGMISESGGDSYQICDYLDIGITKKSLTIEKTFLDLTEKAIVYPGSLVSQMDLTVEYGSIITGTFQTMGVGYEVASQASEFASYNTSFDDPATTSSLNGSVDMPFLATDVTGTWEQDAFCLQSLAISLNNNLTVQNCIGRAAPQDYSLGTAQITADLSSYLKDGNWGMLARKMTQQPFALGFMVGNVDGWYGFYIPALQVSFDDPQSAGANQEVSMEMSGVAKVGANQESSLTIYRAPTL